MTIMGKDKRFGCSWNANHLWGKKRIFRFAVGKDKDFLWEYNTPMACTRINVKSISFGFLQWWGSAYLANTLDEPGTLLSVSVRHVARDGGEGDHHVLPGKLLVKIISSWLVSFGYFVSPGWHLWECERSGHAAQLYWTSKAPGVRVLQLQCRGDVLRQTEVDVVTPASLDEEEFGFPLQFWTEHVVEPPANLEIMRARVRSGALSLVEIRQDTVLWLVELSGHNYTPKGK